MNIIDTIKGALGDDFFELLAKELIKQLLPDLSFIEGYIDEVSKLPESCNRVKDSLNDAQKQAEEQIKNLLPSVTQQFKTKFKNLETNINLLYNCVMQLIPRMTGYIADIVGTCPVGPTVSINKIPTIISQLKNDSEMLGKAYNDVETAYQEFLMGLDPNKLQNDNNVPEIVKFGIGSLAGIITTVLGVAAPLLAIFGISRGGIDAEGNEPTIESPIEAPELLPSDCQNYTPDSDHTTTEPKECKYCTRFVHATPEKSIYEFQDDPEKGTAQEQYDEWYEAWVAENRDSFTCNNCKFFKK